MSFWIVGEVVPSLALSNISFVSETDTSSHLTNRWNYCTGWSIDLKFWFAVEKSTSLREVPWDVTKAFEGSMFHVTKIRYCYRFGPIKNCHNIEFWPSETCLLRMFLSHLMVFPVFINKNVRRASNPSPTGWVNLFWRISYHKYHKEQGQWPRNFSFSGQLTLNYESFMSHLWQFLWSLFRNNVNHVDYSNFYGHLHFVSIFKLGKSNIFTWSLIDKY